MLTALKHLSIFVVIKKKKVLQVHCQCFKNKKGKISNSYSPSNGEKALYEKEQREKEGEEKRRLS